MEGNLLAERLICYARNFLHLEPLDEIYTRNILLREFGAKEPYEGDIGEDEIKAFTVPDVLVKEIETFALENKLCEEFYENLYATYIFGIISPLPSKVNAEFRRIKEEKGIQPACDYLYNLSIKNNYIQKTAIDKNMGWEYVDGDNILEITINLSKPEKDNKEIAKLLSIPKTDKPKYPKCFLCKENEGFEGSLTHPARENIRTISLTMGGEPWFVQYSPYAYYPEHMIAISKSHTPMKVDRTTVYKLADFVDFFPNYMIGSNASLPIIGGSILNHEHYQGGVHLMPMHKAGDKIVMATAKYPEVKVSIVNWYNSVVRMESKNREQITSLCGDIIEAWKTHSSPENEIIAETNGTPHNSCSPVFRKKDGAYIVDLILRNNRTNETYPDGIFHAHPEYHNIKKEGIGLIEAMGLFILPGRLKKQLAMIAEILVDGKYSEELDNADNYLYVHRNMIKDLLAKYSPKTIEEATDIVYGRVNETCKAILGNTAVFKATETGEKGFKAFLNGLDILEV